MNSAKRNIICTIGTRPEAIKMAPVILALKEQPWAEVKVLSTAQHRNMLDIILPGFGITPDIDLDVMRPNQDLANLTALVVKKAADILKKESPDVVLVQGDTTSVMAVSLACFYERIPIGHVEAGLRTGNMLHPFPEEMNRVVTSRLARWHFAPTESARANLLREGIDDSVILVTGNTVIDTLFLDATSRQGNPLPIDQNRKLVLITAHRRENFGSPIRNILAAIRNLAESFPDVQFVLPVHPNPNIYEVTHATLLGLDNVYLCEPLDYFSFVKTMRRAHLIITDSGGVQEEAPALGIPVLVIREETERPEAVETGGVRLVGTDRARIFQEASALLTDSVIRAAMARQVSPYGDGRASGRIVSRLANDLGVAANEFNIDW